MDLVNVHTAKTHLSRLLERVERGEEILIARNGNPVARLTPLLAAPRKPGRLEGKIRLLDDFDDPIPAGLRAAASRKSPVNRSSPGTRRGPVSRKKQ